MPGLDATITFPDPDHFGSPGQQAAVDRLRHLPIEAETPVPHIQMVTAAGEPSDAPPPVGLDADRFHYPERPCDNLQQQRICASTDDGHMSTDGNGCQHCTL